MPVFIVKPLNIILFVLTLVALAASPLKTSGLLCIIVIVRMSFWVNRRMKRQQFEQAIINLSEKGKVP